LGNTAPVADGIGDRSRSCRICCVFLAPEAEFCGACGWVNPRSGTVMCGNCKELIPVNQRFCQKCGGPNPMAPPQNYRPAPNHAAQSSTGALPFLSESVSPYYQEEFGRMQADPNYQGKWNWAAFFWCCLWAITKGLWGPVLLCLVSFLVFAPIGEIP